MAKQAQINAVKPALEAVDKAATKVEKALDVVDKVADKSTDVVESALETVADVVPDALDTAVHVSTKGGRKLASLFRNPKNAAISVVVLSGLVGAGLGVAGYYLAVKRLKSKMQEEFDIQLESEVAEMRRQFVLYNKEGKYSTPAGAADELLPPDVKETILTYRGQGGEPKNVKIEGPAEVHLSDTLSEEDQAAVLHAQGYTDAQVADVLGHDSVDVAALREKMNAGRPVEITESSDHNIFVDGRPVEDFDYAAEIAKRDPETPYVITHDEFMENENGWAQGQLTYYNGDDVLTDDQDMPIPDIEDLVDSENLTKFGYGSRDKNVVYVRNEKKEMDFEITLSQGEFSKEVGGFNELKHSAPVRRFRSGDDE
jgi:hypothetical protein